MAHLAHYKEAHPLIFVVTHWINLIAMIMLILSGIIIHFPVLPFLTGIARGCHLFFGFVLFINCVARVIMAFFVKTAPTGGTRQQVTDFKTWLPQKDNRHQALEWIKYYLFLKKDHPLGAKLGVPQKISYLLIPILIVLMFWTGLCLWGVTMNVPAFAATTNLVGGLMSCLLYTSCARGSSPANCARHIAGETVASLGAIPHTVPLLPSWRSMWETQRKTRQRSDGDPTAIWSGSVKKLPLFSQKSTSFAATPTAAFLDLSVRS